jgi:hypothetical protein
VPLSDIEVGFAAVIRSDGGGERVFRRAAANALTIEPKLAASLYGRGFAKLKKGDTVQGNADIAAAKTIQSNIAENLAPYGIK